MSRSLPKINQISAKEYREKIARKSKYFAKKTVIDGIVFASIAESNAYVALKKMQQEGKISYFLRQVPIGLPGNTKYVVDFLVVFPDNSIKYIDIKGFKTQIYLLKKKQVEALYPIKIEEEI